ncbi:MAG: hypothetical protein H0V11_08120 [Actinobacteria bacterium]|nr:hypothetical protein [Actinomycetota bacterium]
MQVRTLDDPKAFLEQAGALLLADEARHNLVLGLAATLPDHPEVYPDFRLWLVEEDGEVAGAALRTPPHKLALARPRDAAAVAALAQGVDAELPGVVGALPEAEQFARAWAPKRHHPAASHCAGDLRPGTGGAGQRRARRHALRCIWTTAHCCWSGFSPSPSRRYLMASQTRRSWDAASTIGFRLPTRESRCGSTTGPSR